MQEPVGEEIVVRAPRGDRSSIDRETYIVRDTPLAQTRNAIDVLQTLPSVSVDSSGQLRLLGNRAVKILIDGGTFRTRPQCSGPSRLRRSPASR